MTQILSRSTISTDGADFCWHERVSKSMGLTVHQLFFIWKNNNAIFNSIFEIISISVINNDKQSISFVAVSPGSQVYASVSTESIFSTDDVRRLPPSARNCRFSYENDLNYFSRYSQSNCFMERMARKIMRQCHCLPFYFLGKLIWCSRPTPFQFALTVIS